MSELEQVREQGLDKFYTKEDIAKKCMEVIYGKYEKEFRLTIEPSAGNGSFLKQVRGVKIGIDIEPEGIGIKKGDFLMYSPDIDGEGILVVGNPPFGKGCSTAVRFFNHAAKFAEAIAFIIPKTFRRTSIQNRLNLNYKLVHDEDIPENSFTPNMQVKCCYQIWERQEEERKKVDRVTKHEDWEFIGYGPKDENNQPTVPEGVDIAVRAYGGNCGEITQNMEGLRPKSWHFMKAKINIKTLINNLKELDYSIAQDSARQNSLGRADLVKIYEDRLKKKKKN